MLCEMTGNHSRDKPLPVFPTERAFLSGCAMLIPRQVLDHVGVFDERFFMYYEDLDLCIRIGSAGYRLLLVPDAHLWHRVSQSSGGPNTPGERYHMARSSGIYFRKHMRGWRAPLILSYRSLSAMRWTVRLARQGNLRALIAYWRGLCQGWLGVREPRR
jgi:GT2 family glycosyltransferase